MSFMRDFFLSVTSPQHFVDQYIPFDVSQGVSVMEKLTIVSTASASTASDIMIERNRVDLMLDENCLEWT